MSFQRIRGLAHVYGVSPLQLIELIEGQRVEGFADVKVHRIPVAEEGGRMPSRQPGGKDMITLALPEEADGADKEYFAVRLQDDAMTGYTRKGDHVVFDYEGRPNVGDVVALEVPGRGLSVRRYRGFTEAGRYLVAADGTSKVWEAPRRSRIWGVAAWVIHRGS